MAPSTGRGSGPARESGLWGIAFAPFLHAGLAHLIANTIPLLVLGWLVLVRGLRDWLWVTVVVVLARRPRRLALRAPGRRCTSGPAA